MSSVYTGKIANKKGRKKDILNYKRIPILKIMEEKSKVLRQ